MRHTLAVFIVALLTACAREHVLGDGPARRLAIVATLGGDVFALDAGRDTTLVSLPAWQRVSEFGVQAARGEHVLVTSFESFDDRTIRRVKVPSGVEVERVALASIESSSSELGAINLAFGSPFAVSADLNTVAFAQSSASGMSGVIVAELATRQAQWSIAPFAANAVAFGRWGGDNVLFLGGSRVTAVRPSASIFVVSLATRRVVDSIAVGAPTFESGGGLLQLLAVPSRERVVALVNGDIVSCVLELGQSVCGRARVNSSNGRMSFREGDATILVNDVGTRLSSGSGAIYSVAVDASSVSAFVLPLVDGMPRVTRGISALSDGSAWVLTVGTAPFFPSYPEQAPGIVLFDHHRNQILRTIPLPSAPFSPLAF